MYILSKQILLGTNRPMFYLNTSLFWELILPLKRFNLKFKIDANFHNERVVFKTRSNKWKKRNYFF